MFRAAPGLYLVLAPDPARTILDASDAYLHATMTKREEIVGRGLFDVFPDNPDDPAATGTRNLAESLARAIASRAADAIAIQKYDVRRPDGRFEERWWSPVNTPVLDDAGVRYLIHRVEDVTELVRARQEGRALEARVAAEEQRADVRFRDLVDLAPDGVIVCDREGTVLVVNEAAERMFAYSRTELIGHSIEMLVPERARARHAAHVSGFASAPMSRTMGAGLALTGRRKDGSEFPIEISLSPMRTTAKLTILVAIRDITERLRIEEASRRASSYLVSAVEAIQGAFALYDENDRLVLANNAYRELYRSGDRRPTAGQTFAEILDASIRASGFAGAAADSVRERVTANHRAPAGPMELKGLSGRTFRIFEQRTPEGGTVSLFLDITADVERADELRAAQLAAEAASAAKSEFLSSMSHELRTPLNAILGFTELMQRDRKEPPSARQTERLAHVHRAGEHLLRLINDILDLSRIESGRLTVSLEPVDLSVVIDEVVAQLEPQAAQHAITVERPAGPDTHAFVLADRTRLSQILMNFGSNAIKYGRTGGHAVMRTSRVSDGRLRVSIADDGIGIPEDKQASIFEPFQRAGQEAGPIEGTGIGLAISKRLAELMGGGVGFTSRHGDGSEFWVDLGELAHREHRPRRSPGEAWRTTVLAQDGAAFHILYVEDNPSNIALMEALVSELPRISMITARTAEEGIEIVRARRPDLVIMDVNLPGMSGIEAMRVLREDASTQSIPVIALSAGALARDEARASDVGFRRYLTKPIDIDALTAAIEEVLLAAAVPASS
ncbi:MAG: PAS domain S-box protein [Kofleriaceae bacterium]